MTDVMTDVKMTEGTIETIDVMGIGQEVRAEAAAAVVREEAEAVREEAEAVREEAEAVREEAEVAIEPMTARNIQEMTRQENKR
jgi:uncharacterized protein (DUF3084 family)